MPDVRSMLARVQRLERARTAPRSLVELAYGSLDNFEENVQAQSDAGTLDRTEMPIILACIRRWHSDDMFSAWRRDRVWEYGGVRG